MIGNILVHGWAGSRGFPPTAKAPPRLWRRTAHSGGRPAPPISSLQLDNLQQDHQQQTQSSAAGLPPKATCTSELSAHAGGRLAPPSPRLQLDHQQQGHQQQDHHWQQSLPRAQGITFDPRGRYQQQLHHQLDHHQPDHYRQRGSHAPSSRRCFAASASSAWRKIRRASRALQSSSGARIGVGAASSGGADSPPMTPCRSSRTRQLLEPYYCVVLKKLPSIKK